MKRWMLLLPALGLWGASLALDVASSARASYRCILLGVLAAGPAVAVGARAWRVAPEFRRARERSAQRLLVLAWLGYVFQLLARVKSAARVDVSDLAFNALEWSVVCYAAWLSTRVIGARRMRRGPEARRPGAVTHHRSTTVVQRAERVRSRR